MGEPVTFNPSDVAKVVVEDHEGNMHKLEGLTSPITAQDAITFQPDHPSGILLEDRQGNLYLIRKEILSMTRLPDGLAQDLKDRLNEGVLTFGDGDQLSRGSDTGFYVLSGVNAEELEPVAG